MSDTNNVCNKKGRGMKSFSKGRISQVLVLLVLFMLIVLVKKIFLQPKMSEVYEVSLYGRVHQEKWVQEEMITNFFFNTTSMGNLEVRKSNKGYKGTLFYGGNNYVFVFPKTPTEMKDGEETNGTLSVIFELNEETLTQPAIFKKAVRLSDRRIVLELLSGTESSMFVYSAVWLYKENEDGYLLPDQMFQVARRKYEDGVYMMEAIAKERKFVHLQMPFKVNEKH